MLSGRRYSCIVDELHLVGRASGVFAASAGADLCGPGIIACRNRPASPEPYLPVSNTTKAPPNGGANAMWHLLDRLNDADLKLGNGQLVVSGRRVRVLAVDDYMHSDFVPAHKSLQ